MFVVCKEPEVGEKKWFGNGNGGWRRKCTRSGTLSGAGPAADAKQGNAHTRWHLFHLNGIIGNPQPVRYAPPLDSHTHTVEQIQWARGILNWPYKAHSASVTMMMVRRD
ncbi:hypothetical protein F66182_17097, partial [Fusarium sp. NRRL 66182]